MRNGWQSINMKVSFVFPLFFLTFCLTGCSISLLEEVSVAIPVSPPSYLAEGYNAALKAKYEAVRFDPNMGVLSVPSDADIGTEFVVNLFSLPGFLTHASDVSKMLLAPAINLEVYNKLVSYEIRQYRCFIRVSTGKRKQGQVGDITIPMGYDQ